MTQYQWIVGVNRLESRHDLNNQGVCDTCLYGLLPTDMS